MLLINFLDMSSKLHLPALFGNIHLSQGSAFPPFLIMLEIKLSRKPPLVSQPGISQSITSHHADIYLMSRHPHLKSPHIQMFLSTHFPSPSLWEQSPVLIWLTTPLRFICWRLALQVRDLGRSVDLWEGTIPEEVRILEVGGIMAGSCAHSHISSQENETFLLGFWWDFKRSLF